MLKEQIRKLAAACGIRITYAFGSRAQEVREVLSGRTVGLSPGDSDLDIGAKASTRLSINEKVDFARNLEDLFEVNRVDLVILDEVNTAIAYEAVTGTLLYCVDPVEEAEYQLYIMRKYAELLPYYREAEEMLLEVER